MRTADVPIQAEDASLAHWIRLPCHRLQESGLGNWSLCNWILFAMPTTVALPLAVMMAVAFALVQLPMVFVMPFVSLLSVVQLRVLGWTGLARKGDA